MSIDLSQYPSQVELKVQWGDMDAARHVNNTVYLRYFETARINFFQVIDFMNFGDNAPIGPILAEISCKYKAPLTYPDTIMAAARIIPESIDEFGFSMHSIIYSHKLQRIAAEGTARLVCYDYVNLKKVKIPEELLAKITVV